MSTAAQNELSVGIEVYANKALGFVGVIKQRYSDFIVREVDYSGKVAVLGSTDGRACQESAFDVVKIDTADSEEAVNLYISELVGLGIKIDHEALSSFLISCVNQDNAANAEYVAFEGLSKEARTAVHKGIKKYFPSTADTESVQKSDVTFISIRMKKRGVKATGFKRSQFEWPASVGDYLKFTMLKENIDTMNAINTIAKTLRIKATKISYSGTKDKRAITVQWCTVHRKRPYELMRLNQLQTFPLIRLGDFEYVKEEIKLGQLLGNRFEIILRDVSVSEAAITEACRDLSNSGFVNYFGLQRFGKGGVQSHITGRQILKGDWKGVVDMLFTPRENEEPNRWQAAYASGNYEQAYSEVPEHYFIERNVLEGLLACGTDLLGAYNRTPKHSRLICLHAYQSYIWNIAATERVRTHGLQCIEGDLYVTGDDAAIDSHDEGDNFQVAACSVNVKVATAADVAHIDMRNVVLPLPGYDSILPANSIGNLYIELLEKDGLSLAAFGQNGCHEYNSTGAYRRVLQKPLNFEFNVLHYDDCNAELADTELGRFKGGRSQYEAPTVKKLPPGQVGSMKALQLKFTLPPGTYATMLLRELTKESTDTLHQASLTEATRTRNLDVQDESTVVPLKKRKLEEGEC